jgi:hypothetical protein
MGLTLTTHDRGFQAPDDATIGRVLASLDGGVHVLATLGESETTYLEATGSAQAGFCLEYQEGSLDRHYRSKSPTLPLRQVTEVFQKYARGDASWRRSVEWERVVAPRRSVPWSETWVGLAVLLLLVIALVWWWRSP